MKKKWNYAIVKSVFGDLWVGKTQLPADEKRVFADVSDVVDKAKELFLEQNPMFDPDNEDDEDTDAYYSYEQLQETTEETIEEIRKEMEHFIVEAN